MLFDWLVTGQVVPVTPAAFVRGPKHLVKCGKTPVLSAEDARRLIDSIDVTTPIGLRDRALIGVMVYTFAVVGMRIENYYQNVKRWWLRLHGKGGKFHEVPAHYNAETYLDAYLDAAGKTGQLTAKPLQRNNALRWSNPGRSPPISAYLENGGTIEKAQQIAAHESPKTTKLYDRTVSARNNQSCAA